jgi:hypothetical protein
MSASVWIPDSGRTLRHFRNVPRTDSSTAATLDLTEGVIFPKNARPRPNRLAAERYAIG